MAATTYTLFFGSTAAGGHPTWNTFADNSTGTPISPQPVFTDVGGGFYQFPFDWTTTASTAIRYDAALATFADQWDVIISSPVPGTMSSALQPQNLALYPNAATVINRAAKQIGLSTGTVTDPFSSSDPGYILLCDLLSTVGTDLLDEHEWTHLIQPMTFTSDGVTLSYMLPPDFRSQVDQTTWNRSTRLPGIGPLSMQQATALQARLVSIVLNITFQIQGGLLTLPIVPPSGQLIAFDYCSRYWVNALNSGTPNQAKPVAYTDILLFEEELLLAGLKLAYLSEKGFDTMAAEAAFDARLESAIGRNMGAPVLSLGDSGRNAFDRMLDGRNVPDGNWPTAG